ncbi:hypothetical protein [Streptomyces sp. NPDC090445]|uniref:hypothetical protein n=1 Tax=Streptomyces sp. NPDC090445 TaxID=3365963 RepID=UPI00380E34A6
MSIEQRDEAATPATPSSRIAWIAGGVALIVLGVALIWVTQDQAADLSEDIRLVVNVAMRGATFLLLGGGAWCLARGWKRT